MGLTINRPGIDPYSNNLLKQTDETRRSAHGYAHGKDKEAEKGQHDPSVRLSLSKDALAMLENDKTEARGLKKLSSEEQEEMQALASELDEIVGGAGGFRKLTETQWERVEDIFGRIAELNDMEGDEKPRIAELRQIFKLEDELGAIYGDEPGKVLSPEEKERVEEIMLELEGLWGGQEEIQLSDEEEKQLAQVEAELEKLFGKIDDWSLTPADEKQADKLFGIMDGIYDKAEQRMLKQSRENERTVEGV